MSLLMLRVCRVMLLLDGVASVYLICDIAEGVCPRKYPNVVTVGNMIILNENDNFTMLVVVCFRPIGTFFC